MGMDWRKDTAVGRSDVDGIEIMGASSIAMTAPWGGVEGLLDCGLFQRRVLLG